MGKAPYHGLRSGRDGSVVLLSTELGCGLRGSVGLWDGFGSVLGCS